MLDRYFRSAWLPHSPTSVDNAPVFGTFTSSAIALNAVVCVFLAYKVKRYVSVSWSVKSMPWCVHGSTYYNLQ